VPVCCQAVLCQQLLLCQVLHCTTDLGVPRQAGKRDGRGGGDAGAADGPLPRPAEHLQRKVLRRVRFLEKVAAARPRPALAPSGGVRKKKRRRPPHGRAAQLPDLSTLAASLADAAHDLERREAAPRKGLGVGGAKARSRIVTAETRRLQQVPTRTVLQSLLTCRAQRCRACLVSCGCRAPIARHMQQASVWAAACSRMGIVPAALYRPNKLPLAEIAFGGRRVRT